MKKLTMLLTLLLTVCLSVSPALADTTLTMLNGGETDWQYEFMDENPDIHLAYAWPETDGYALQSLMMTNEAYDIYHQASGPLYQALKEKGYLLALDDAGPAAQFAAQTYPYLQKLLAHDGQVAAIPIVGEYGETSVMPHVWSYHPEAWAEEGVGELPQTWAELLRRCIDWETQHQDSPYRLFDGRTGRGEMPVMLLQAYVLCYEPMAEDTFTFDTPIFRELMGLLKEYHDVREPRDERPALLESASGYLGEADMTDTVWIAPPVFEEGQSPQIPVDVRLYAINRRTRHPDEAKKLLEAAVSFYDPISLMLMCPGEAREIREGKNVVISQAQAENVAELMRYAMVDTDSVVLSGGNTYNFEELIMQYLDGAIDLEQLIRQINQRADGMFRESR